MGQISADVTILDLDDDVKLRLGTGKDAEIYYDGTNLIIDPDVVAGSAVNINHTANNANMTIGLTINQGANDDEILALKSTDVAHGLTTAATVALETDTFYAVRKGTGAGGGVLELAVSDLVNHQAVRISEAYSRGPLDTNKTTAGRALHELYGSMHDGANALSDLTADSNLFAVRGRVSGSNVSRFIVDEDGDLFAVNATVTALDAEDDVALVRAFELSRTDKGIVRDEWDEFVSYNEEDLVRVGVLGAPVANGGLWNVTQHMRLLNGAIWQQAKKIMALEQRLEALPSGGN